MVPATALRYALCSGCGPAGWSIAGDAVEEVEEVAKVYLLRKILDDVPRARLR
jgi:hypothetical protein